MSVGIGGVGMGAGGMGTGCRDPGCEGDAVVVRRFLCAGADGVDEDCYGKVGEGRR